MNTVQCYDCDTIRDGEPSDEELQNAEDDISWGWTWGSDGFAPDEASAMYACPQCKNKDWYGIVR
jgi:hypothetical protein